MHIPDGYLSPQTYIPLIGVFVTVSAVAVKKVKDEVSARDIPYLGSSFFIYYNDV
jgi:cobalt/nickel transport system permease protein